MASDSKVTRKIRSVKGLDPLNVELYNEELEKLVAEYLINSLRRLDKGFLESSLHADNLVFEKRLIDFALRERISFFKVSWRTRAVEAVAQKYLLEQSRKRTRGRPTAKFNGILSGILEKFPELDLVEKIRVKLGERGKNVSNARIIKFIVACNAFGGNLPITEQQKNMFDVRVRVYANKVSKQRAKKGLPRRHKKSH